MKRRTAAELAGILARAAAFLDQNRENILDDLAALCRIPSVSRPGADGLPFGKDVDDVFRYLHARCEALGVDCTVKSELGYATAQVNAASDKDLQRAVGIYSHCDVVPANPEEWTKAAPFEPKTMHGYLYARGSEDNKCAAVSAVYLAKMVRDGILPLHRPLVCFFGGSEENGMQDMAAYKAHEVLPALCLVPDCSYPVCVGEKGILRLTARPRRAFRQIAAFEGGVAVNAVIGTACCKIADEGGLWEELCEKTDGSTAFSLSRDETGKMLTLTSVGKSSHASAPQGSVNAAVSAAKLLSGCAALCENDREILAALAALGEDYYGGAVGIAADDPDFGQNTFVLGLCGCEAGNVPFFSFDIRFGRAILADAMKRALEEAFSRAGFDLSFDHVSECFVTGADRRFVETIKRVFAAESGEANPQAYYSRGGTYARELGCALSIGTQNYRARTQADGPEDLLPPGHGGVHQPDERIALDAYFSGILINCMILLAVDEDLCEREAE